MDPLNWWRLWISSGVTTCLIAIACCWAIVRTMRSEMGRCLVQIKTDYQLANNRLDLLSNRMDSLEAQILKILLHLYPEETKKEDPVERPGQ